MSAPLNPGTPDDPAPVAAQSHEPTYSPSLDARMERIAECESSNNPKAKNANSTASGRFMFIHATWVRYGTEYWGSLEGRSVFNYADNTELAYYVANKYGFHDWDASRPCWSK